jgi:hypothetical protein
MKERKNAIMNEQSPINNPEPFDRREARRQRREARLADPSQAGSWVAGLVLIVLGGMFLLRNMGTVDMPLKNWWALFILIPAVGAFESALRMYRNDGNQFNAAARGSLLVGTVLSLITLMFLFEISWTFFGPVLIILVGIAIIFNYTFSNKE